MKIIQLNKEDVYENYRYMGISAILCEKSVTKKLFDNILQLSEKEKVPIQKFSYLAENCGYFFFTVS